jgi:hypothetical protein
MVMGLSRPSPPTPTQVETRKVRWPPPRTFFIEIASMGFRQFPHGGSGPQFESPFGADRDVELGSPAYRHQTPITYQTHYLTSVA